MELDCEGCAGCCIDWRPLVNDDAGNGHSGAEQGRGGRRDPLDDVHNLVPLDRDEVSAFVDDGLGDALTPRLFEPAPEDDRVVVDGQDVATIGERPVFVIGLRKPPKPVGPFGTDPNWLPTCVFLDPETLQCRVYEDDHYPDACATYPGHNLEFDRETECERVEDAFGGHRLLDDTPPTALPAPTFGPAALGTSVFAYPDQDQLDGVVDRLQEGDLTTDDRARFVGAAVGSRPGSLEVNAERAAEAVDAVRSADSWAGRVVDAWIDRPHERSDRSHGTSDRRRGVSNQRPHVGEAVGTGDRSTAGWAASREERLGAPGTPGWEDG